MATHLSPSRSFHLRFGATEFWSGDRGLTLVTISLVIFIFVILPMQESGLPGRFLFDAIMLSLMVSGALTVGKNRLTTAFALGILLTATIALWVSIVYPTVTLHRISSFLAIFAFLFYARIVLLVMFRSGRVTWSRIQGGISAYMLLGLMWASAYELTEHFHSGSFRFLSQPADAEQLAARLVYFGFATLTTVGFGDVTAVHPFARSLAIAEALTGQLFPAILIGTLVTIAMQSTPNRDVLIIAKVVSWKIIAARTVGHKTRTLKAACSTGRRQSCRDGARMPPALRGHRQECLCY